MLCSCEGLNTNGSRQFVAGFKVKNATLNITNVKAHSFWNPNGPNIAIHV